MIFDADHFFHVNRRTFWGNFWRRSFFPCQLTHFFGVIFDADHFFHVNWRTFLGWFLTHFSFVLVIWRNFWGVNWRIVVFANGLSCFQTAFSCFRTAFPVIEWPIHTLMIFQLLPFSKWHFSKTVDFCGTQGDLTLSFPTSPNPIVNLVFCSVYVKFKVYATCFWTSFSCLRTAFPVIEWPILN